MKTIDIKNSAYEGSFSPLNNPDSRKQSAIAAFMYSSEHSRTNLADSASKEGRKNQNEGNLLTSKEYLSGGGRV